MIDKNKTLFLGGLLFCLGVLACRSTRGYQTTITTNNSSYHLAAYDDTTLTPLNAAILMPYNRFVDAAGTVVRFGDKALENHSLDCALLPGEKVLVVEDRFGVAFIDAVSYSMMFHLDYGNDYKGFVSTYCGLKILEDESGIHVLWSACNKAAKKSFVFDAVWDGKKAVVKTALPFQPAGLSDMALPNDLLLRKEDAETFLYVVLNGNNTVEKIRWKDKKTMWSAATGMAPFGIAEAGGKLYVTNWAGPVPEADGAMAGIPYARVYIDPTTGATATGTVTILDAQSGKRISDIQVGLHPNDIISSPDQQFIYVANANSDNISVIKTATNTVVDPISVQLNPEAGSFIGDSPTALAINATGNTLYVANGLDNAVAVIRLGTGVSTRGKGASSIEGFIPTEAYPAGLLLSSGNDKLYVANLEGEGARVKREDGNYNTHRQEATVSIIPLPGAATLRSYTARVQNANLVFRAKISNQLPRQNIAAKPVPQRIGEPSLFKHVFYIIKENRTYDQVLGDMPEGDGRKDICIYGDTVTPNHHRLVRHFMLMDNYYASGKSSGEGHQWTDAAMVTDYVERNVQAWFNSYPHIQTDAMVYSKKGFIWNNALDHGKTVRIYGEATTPVTGKLTWTDIYNLYKEGKQATFPNVTTISRVEPILAPRYPGFDSRLINDQIRVEAFVKEFREFEKMPGDQLPQLIIMALPGDHTAGTREGSPRPEAMVADNDLALGKIMDVLTHSRFWDSTAVFVTEDDSQGGWDHVSAYRTVGFVMSPYSRLQKTVHTNYNQTCIVRTIEQILGLPPMNVIDATALPMFDCFTGKFDRTPYTFVKNNVPLDIMNKAVATLTGKEKQYAMLSASKQYEHIDSGDDDLLNRILWFAAKGPQAYPQHLTIPKKHRKDDDDDDD